MCSCPHDKERAGFFQPCDEEDPVMTPIYKYHIKDSACMDLLHILIACVQFSVHLNILIFVHTHIYTFGPTYVLVPFKYIGNRVL